MFGNIFKNFFQAGGCYLYSNLRGGDGGRVYFNGCSCVSFNGDVVARTQQFSLIDVVSCSNFVRHKRYKIRDFPKFLFDA